MGNIERSDDWIEGYATGQADAAKAERLAFDATITAHAAKVERLSSRLAGAVEETAKLRLALDMAADDAERFTPEQYVEMAETKLALAGGGSRVIGRVYSWRGCYWRVLARWSGKGPRNVLLERVWLDGAGGWRAMAERWRVVRPFRGLRRT